MDYYKILGVSIDVSPEELKSAYHKLVRQNHPDAHPNQQDLYVKKMQQINLAYDYLSKKLSEEENISKDNGFSNSEDKPEKTETKEPKDNNNQSGYRWNEMRRNTYYSEGKMKASRADIFILKILNLPLIIICSCLYLPYSFLLGYILLFVRYYYSEQNTRAKRRTEILFGIMLLITVFYIVYIHK